MGGDHKCPLCSATFTRPQHVGRHLRAHTGDRPYECKECPLRFARSDLLSRHVNKAHRPPGEEDKKDGRRGRRKSLGSQSQSDKEGLGPGGAGGLSRMGMGMGMSHDKIRAASFSQFGRPDMSALAPAASSGFDGAYQARGGLPHAQAQGHAQTQQQRSASQSHAQTALPAHAMYPHHPLLSDSPRSSVSHNLAAAGLISGTGAIAGTGTGAGTGTAQWAYQPGVNGYMQPTDFTNPFPIAGQNPGAVPGVNLGMAGHPYAALGMSSPFTATPMRFSASGSALGMGAGMGMAGMAGVPGMPGGSSTMGRNTSNYSGTSIDYGNKKRACDQCNHSKVRCDFNDPCARCTTRNLGCSYNKPPKSRSIVQPMPWAAQRLSMPNMGSNSAANISLSLSPTASTVYSSPSSQPSVSPTAATATIGMPGVAGAAQQSRSQSFGNATQAQYYASPQTHMPGALAGTYQQAYPALQGWQAGVGPEQGTAGFVDYSAMALPSTIDPLQTHDGQRSNLAQQQLQQPVYGHTQSFYSSPHATLQNFAPAIDPALGGSPLIQANSHGYALAQGGSSASMQPPPTIPQAPQRQISNPASMRSEKSNGSPSSHLAPTPSLTSHSTSPSGSDEPAERRGSSMSAMAGVLPEPFVRGVDPTPILQEATLGGAGVALQLSPSSLLPQPVGAGGSSSSSSTVAPSSGLPSSSSSGEHTAGAEAAAWYGHVATSGAGAGAGASADAMRDRASRASESTFDEGESGSRSRADSLAQSMSDEAGLREGSVAQHRRRFSTSGVWANAFNAMSLQDHQLQANALAPLQDGMADPFSASQLAQMQSAQQRPGFPTYDFGANGDAGEGAGRMPSMSDVKDLWKLFMSEPMAGFTPVGEKGNAMEGSTDATPRPNLRNRTLSKSNSVPDLTSPFLGQAFFSNYLNTVTPRQEKGAMIGAHDGDAMDQNQDLGDKPLPDTAGLTEDEQARVLSKWRKEIQSRQTSFSFQPQMQVGGRLGKAGASALAVGGSVTGAAGLIAPTSHMYAGIPGMTSTAFGGMTFDLAGRPTASVLQANGLSSNSRVRAMGMGGALDQTLAPERVPSFSMTPTLGQGPGGGAGAVRDGGFLRPAVTLREGSKLSGAVAIAGRGVDGAARNGAMGMGTDKGTSATTRPGNKRLASQTLVPGDGKKAVFGFFDEEEDGTFA